MSEVDGFGQSSADITFPVKGAWRSRSAVRGRIRLMLVSLALGLTLTGVAAQETAVSIAAASCGACHGPDGRSTGAIPSIDKLDAVTMGAKLKGFRSGEIESTVMNRLAKGFTEAEIDSLIRFMAAK
jgi:cytochrome c553